MPWGSPLWNAALRVEVRELGLASLRMKDFLEKEVQQAL